MLDPAYEAKKYEDDIYRKWEESGAFKADNASGKPPFTISMPPPNATGTLHLGHAVMLALEDILTRHRRMKGYEALWVPGTDHAAIATESVVIKNLQAEGLKNPRELGREELVKRIAKFVEGSQNTIRSQVRKMGSSCDWSREKYTMDASLNRCVNEVFKKMYDDGLIYRGERVVNWDVALQTTLADDEVIHEEQEGTLYTFVYLSAEQTGSEPLLVSTSRPETKLGDSAIAVHPDDERYKHLIGKHFEVTWPNSSTAEKQKITVTVIADHEVDKDFGTGALGVTPFHSKIDYDMWMRHRDKIKAEPIHVINEQGRITDSVKGYEGLKVKEAREKFVEELKAAGLLKEEKKYTQQMAISYRSKKVVEPLPKLQWFIDVNKKVVHWPATAGKNGKKMSLKEVMREVVESGKINLIPDRFTKTYFHWIDNLQDWCISRQIWWGHQIPVWYCLEEKAGCDKPIASITEPKNCSNCGGSNMGQDADTLDTWFSSAMWTWSTLVDEKQAADMNLSLEEILKASPDFQKFHPTQVMETGYDILFFWVARMILMTTYAIGDVPFENVYLHGLIRTREGKKMSKSDPKTCIDPLDMIEQYGADALRMSMVIGNSPGNDMRLYEEKIKGYRNFTNKLWNASRFVLGVLEEKGVKEMPAIDENNLSDTDEWILGKLNDVITKADTALMDFHISEAGQLLYDFLWNDFCDWYLELSKGKKQNLGVLCRVLRDTLTMLHPLMPFVTEQIWSQLPTAAAGRTAGTEGMLIHAEYPKPTAQKYEGNATESVISVVTAIRKLRAENGVEAAAKIAAVIYGHEATEKLKGCSDDIIRLARLSDLKLEENGEKPDKAATDIVGGIEIYLHLEGLVDTEKEKARLKKEVEQLEKYIATLSAKLMNKNFVQSAPSTIVEAEKARLKEAEEKKVKLEEQMKSLLV